MPAKREVAVVEDPRFLEHQGPLGHPERPDRLDAVRSAIDARAASVRRVRPRQASGEEILRVHSRAHLACVEEAAARGPGQLDPDTYVSRQSFDVACLAAGATIDLLHGVARGEIATGLAAVRPPGHHAESDRAMGFCLFNNAAIATRAIQAERGVERVLIFDWDVHHGNGTQHVFEADPSVLYASVHQYPFYPGTGAAAECGEGRGEGFTLNIPLPAGSGDAEYLGVLQRLLVPAAEAFRPELVLISCGFDAHRDDPLGAMQVSREGYRGMAAIVRALADDLCGGRLAFVLEGGYAPSGLIEGVDATLEAIVGVDPTALPATAPALAGSVTDRVVEQVLQVHGRDFPQLSAH